MIEIIRRAVGHWVSRVPVDNHELGDLVDVAERVEALEHRMDTLVARAELVDQERHVNNGFG
jgi:hypothetical protein